MEQFATLEMLATFSSMVMIVFSIVAFTKELKYPKMLRTDYYSWIVAFLLIAYNQLMTSDFKVSYIPLYAISAIFVSVSAGKLSDKTQSK